MSKELMYTLITKMHVKLNSLIETNNYNLLSPTVQTYSRRLDKVLTRYNRLLENSHKCDYKLCSYKSNY
ncbi:MAG TPA: Spo0E family sporulation regulatory protein-aspartic acid phosphatase [Clostridia bacterium]|nr:Spo0E family sporulation regulatory protein-aspartic acid phosphatase [Clostridia bacterium]